MNAQAKEGMLAGVRLMGEACEAEFMRLRWERAMLFIALCRVATHVDAECLTLSDVIDGLRRINLDKKSVA